MNEGILTMCHSTIKGRKLPSQSHKKTYLRVVGDAQNKEKTAMCFDCGISHAYGKCPFKSDNSRSESPHTPSDFLAPWTM